MQTTTVIRRSPEGWQRRTQLDFDKLIAMERSLVAVTRMPTNVTVVYDYWLSLRRGGIVRLKDFAPRRDLGKMGVTVTQIDVDSDNPWHYRFTSHKGVYFGWMNGKCLADFPLTPVIDECAIEYFECKSAGRPVAHHIEHELSGFRRDYLRLLLPLSGCDGSPRALVSVVRHLALQDLAGSSRAIHRG